MKTEQQFLESFRQQVAEGLKIWDFPSVAIGIIKDGRVVLSEGFGMRDNALGLPATGKTLYQIGSCSKAFTSALVAIMVDQGKLSWDAPIGDLLPEIRFYDPAATEQLTLRDMLCHRSGLPRHEYAWYGTNFSKSELMHNLRYLEPNKPIRSTFQYNNFGYMLAGYAVERVTGKSWEECLKEYIFEPLGMERSNAFIDAILADPDHGTPYDRTDPNVDLTKGQREIPFYKMDEEDYEKGIGAPLGPAGSINSCPEEMLKWVQLHLQNGEYNGKRIISEAQMKELHRPHIPMTQAMEIPCDEIDFENYSLGWFVESFRGHKVLQHGGSINGFIGYTSFIPDLNLGVVAYTNMNLSHLPQSLAFEVYDYYMGYEGGNWVQRYFDYLANRWNNRDTDVIKVFTGEQKLGTTPAHAMEEYCGTYSRPGYTPAVVTLEDGVLHFDFIGAKCSMTHFHYETFTCDKIVGELPPGVPVHFHTAEVGGEVDGFAMPLCPEEGAELVRFKKQK